MNAIFAKLNYKSQPEIAFINAPAEFLSVVNDMRPLATIVTDVAEIQRGTFAMAFLKTQQEVDALSPVLADKLTGDGILWLAYPKGSSKKHKCDFNRDNGWTVLSELGFEPVRMVAIDEEWSALRFRRVDFIKKMTRQSSRTMTEQGKTRTTREAT
ncbi:hypothetical protein [Spirosoma endophyticum]|uniref:DUF3052 domain-containing protein n=1 Tax=Spirosoma endophyticum TaxID=662367 RepID=A0A1I1R477_9BACT|nr:hypothetical protein [Spirosoma endophyticum]SFD29089.1 hypothetical protein SAMN05216167_104236 [Spirosoma endophyticum]